MSRTVDERVVSMQFDNKHFESNVATTMSTLGKLKQSLDLSGASRGLENIGAAAGKCDMTPLGNAVEGVRTKFSALEIMGVTALVNITNSAVNAGKRIASALTIDPVKTGLQEYETQINAVQTILANTESKGSTIDDVNKALEELNKYADMTIYNFTEMTRNIGTFTAAGVDLETSTNAIKGIANLAAVSGSTSQQASTAMYQLSQALASGTVKLMDWNSVVNAGMGGQVFQDALKETARVHGVAIDEMIDSEGSFRETLKDGWLTSEILTDTLEKFTMYAEEGTKEWDEYMKALKQKGYTEEQAREILKLGKTATEAATKVKTFTQLFDVLKESAQSGWSQSWKIIIGDFEEAKALLSPLADVLTGIIGKFSDARNFFLEGVLAFSGPWEKISEKLESIKKVSETIKSVTGDLEYFQNIVHRVWRGEFNNNGDNPDRRDLLRAAGYDPRVVQDLVNKGATYKLTVEDIEASHKKFGITMEQSSESTEEVASALESLTDEQLKNAGLTEDEIKLYRDLEKEADRLGISVDELAKKMSENTGRDLLIDSFKNVGDAIIGIFKAIGNAWGEFFSGPSIARTYTLLETFNKFTESLRFTDKETGKLNETGEKFQRIFKGVFAVIHVATTVIGGPLKLALELVNKVLGAFNLDILGFVANISDLIVAFHDWFLENNFVMKGIEKLAGWIAEGIKWVQNWVNEFKQLEFVQEFWSSFTTTIGTLFTNFGKWFGGFGVVFGNFFRALGELDEITFDSVLMAFSDFRDELLAHFKELPKIFSGLLDPVKKFSKALLEHFGLYDEFEKAKDRVMTLVEAFKKWFAGLREAEDPIQYIIDSIKNSLGKAISSFTASLKGYWTKIWSVLTGTAKDNADGMSESGEEVGSSLVSGIVKGIGEGIKTIAKTIITFCTTIIDTACEILGIHSPSTVFFAIGGFIIAGLIAGLANKSTGLFKTIGEMTSKLIDKFKNSGVIEAVKTFAKKIGRILGSLVGWIREHFDSIAAIIGGVGIAIAAFRLTKIVDNLTEVLGAIPEGLKNMFESFGKAREMKAKAKLVLSYAIGIGVLAAALYYMAKLEWGEIGKGVVVIAALGVILGALTLALVKLTSSKDMNPDILNSSAKNIKAVAKVMIGIAASIAILAYAITLIDGVGDNIWRNLGVIAILAVGIAGLSVVMSKLAPKMTKGSLSMIAISVAVLLLVLALSKINALTLNDPESTIKTLLILVGGLALVALASKGVSGKAALGLIGMVIAIHIFMSLLDKIAKMDTFTIERSMGMIAKIVITFGAIMLATRVAGNNAKGAGKALVSVGIALLLVSFAIKLLGNMDSETLKNGTNAVTQLLVVFGLIIALTKFAGEHAAKAGAMLIAAAAAILILVAAISLLSRIDDAKGLARATIVVSVLLTLLAGLVYVSKFAADAKGSLIAIAVTIGILVAAIGLLTIVAKEHPKQLAAALGSLVVVMLALGAVIKSMQFIKTEKGALLNTISTLVFLGIIIVILGQCIKELSTLEPQKALAAAGALSMALLALTAAIWILGQVKNIETDAFVMAGVMLAIVYVLGEILKGLTALDPMQAIGTATALSIVLNALASACLILSQSKNFVNDAIVAAIAMSIVAGILCIVLSSMNGLDTGKAIGNAIALSIVLNALAAACLILSHSKNFVNDAIVAALAMSIVAGILGIVLSSMNGLDSGKAIGNAIALSIVLNALAAACLILSHSKNFVNDAITAALAMSIVAGILSIVLSSMNGLDTGKAIGNAVALSVLLIALTFACNLLDGVKNVSLGAIGAVALLGLVLIELTVILGFITGMSIEPCLGTVVTLSVLLIALSLVTVILAQVGANAINAIPAAIGLAGVIAVIAAIILALSGLMSTISPDRIEEMKRGLEGFMDLIVILARGLGEAVGAFVGGALSEVGKGLSDFMTNIQGFIDGAKQIDMSVADGIKALAAAILAITAASILDGMSKLFGLGSMEELGATLSSFGSSMISFCGSISTLTEEDIGRIKMAAEAGTEMAKLESAIPKQGGWAQAIMGSSDMADFGARMEAFGASLVAFSGSIKNLTEEDASRITSAATAGVEMAKMEDAVPKQGGWAQAIMGASDMADFGLRMEAFGESLVAFAGSIKNLTEEDASRITSAATAGTEMTKMEDSIPRKDGWWQAIAGEKDIKSFGASMEAFGKSLVNYAQTVSGLKNSATEDITRSKDAAKALTEVYDVLPEDKGWWGDIAGETNIASFADGMIALANALNRYSKVAATIDDEDVTNIEGSKDAVVALNDIADYLNGEGLFNLAVGDCTNISSFATSMISLANTLVDYSATVSSGIDVTKIENSKTALEALYGAYEVIPYSGDKNLPTFGTQMVAVAQDLMDYYTKVREFDSSMVETIEFSATAMTAMANAAKAVPNSGGVAGWLAGDNDDITSFGDNMVKFADQVSQYYDKVSGFDASVVETIEFSATAMTAMANAAAAVPNSGGVGGWLFGDNNDLVTFGTNMASLAGSLMSYASTVSEISSDNVTDIETSAEALTALCSVALQTSYLAVYNTADITTIHTNLLAAANLIQKYLYRIEDVNGDTVTRINMSGYAIIALVNVATLTSHLATIVNTDVTVVANNLLKAADLLQEYLLKIAGINGDTVVRINMSGYAIMALANVASIASYLNAFSGAVSDSAINQLKKILELAKGMSGVDFNGMNSFAAALGNLGRSGVTQFIKAFDDSYTRVNAAGSRLIDEFLDGAKLKKENIKSTFESLGKAGAGSIQTQTVYNAYSSAGKYVVDGFSAGISANTFKAEATAAAMARAALIAAKNALAINSPSKVFRDIVGRSVPEGFAAGIDKFGYMVKESANTMADNAIEGTRKAISRIADIVNSDIDTQPTIRPVLDLSDVASGANAISGMFSMTPSVDILSNVGSISSMMNTNQNGANDDVISAINSLKGALGTNTGDTISVNGITYDDGSNIADAVKSLVRAARVERRI